MACKAARFCQILPGILDVMGVNASKVTSLSKEDEGPVCIS